MKRAANLSHDGIYRYLLRRDLERDGKTALFVGVNPSTADADMDDATIRKLYGFSDRLGIGRFIVANKFAFRATDVKALRTAIDPIGQFNDAYLESAMREADLHIMAWGPLAKLPPHLRGRWKRVVDIAQGVGCDLMCLGTAQDGQPRHPLMLGYDTPLTAWKPLG